MNDSSESLCHAEADKPSASRLLAVAVAYFITGWLGLQIAIVGSNITLIWLPTGIAVAALFRWGWRYYPAVWLAAFAVNLSIGSPLWVAGSISIGNTLAPVVAAALLRRWKFNAQILSFRDVPVFVGGGALVGMMVSASWGVASLIAAGMLPWSASGWAWTTWWLGDAVGVIVAGLALVTFDSRELSQLLRGKARRELPISLCFVVLVGWGWTQSHASPLGDTAMFTIAIPTVVWLAMRLGPWVAATAVLILSSCAALALLVGRHQLQGEPLHLAILILWSRMALLAVLTMLVAALTAERRRMEAQLRLSDQVLLSISQGVVISRPDRTIISNNAAFSRITGYNTAEILGKNCNFLQGVLTDPACVAAINMALGKRQAYSGVILNYRKDGETFWNELTISPITDEQGELMHFVDMVCDITERRRVELALQERTQELLRSNGELEQFSYSISHDMRQPLRMISSYMQLLQKSLGDTLDAEKREYFNFAIDGAKRMDAMMVGLLDYSRVGRKGEPAAILETRTVLDEAMHFLRPLIAEGKAQFCIEGDWPRIVASPDELLRLLQNLLGNALKFRGANRLPQISIVSAITDQQWQVSITDNGVGIPPDQIDRLFQVFQRLHSRAAYEGTGIGLALCRKIVEHHGGSILAESAGEGLGSRFTFTLPIAIGVTEAPVGVSA